MSSTPHNTKQENTQIAIVSILFLTAINCFGIKFGAWTQNGFTLLKIGALLTLIILSFVLRGGSWSNFSPVFPTESFSKLAGPLGLAMVAVLWSYDGWIEITYVAGEVKYPQRNIPLSLFLSTLIMIVIYILINFYAMSCGAVLILRKNAADMNRPYKTWGYPFAPWVFILFSVWLVVNTIIHDPRGSAIGAGIILLGLPAYFYWKRKI
ncbi:MAG: amino acid permease [bacterium]